MTPEAGAVRRRPGARATAAGHTRILAAAVVVGLLSCAALSLTLSSEPHFDAWGWLVWGRQLATHPAGLNTFAGPAWKPLPVLVSALLTPAGSAQPTLWLVVARAGGCGAVVLVAATAFDRDGRLAAVVAAVALSVSDRWWLGLSWGISEPLMIALLFLALRLGSTGRQSAAHAALLGAALVRVEVWPLLALHALWALRRHELSGRVLGAGVVALVALWFGPDWYSTGDPFHQSAAAIGGPEALATPHDLVRGGVTVLRRALGVLPWAVWALAAVGLLRAWVRRNAVLLVVAGAAVLWDLTVLALTLRGYAGLARFTVPAAAGVCVLGGTGAAAVVDLGGRTRARAGVVAGAAALAALLGPGIATAGLRDLRQTRGADGKPEIVALERAVHALGGPHRTLGLGAVRVNGALRTALSWTLGTTFNHVNGPSEPSGRLVVFSLRPGAYAGTRPMRPVASCWTLRTPGLTIALAVPRRRHCAPARPSRRGRTRVRAPS